MLYPSLVRAWFEKHLFPRSQDEMLDRSIAFQTHSLTAYFTQIKFFDRLNSGLMTRSKPEKKKKLIIQETPRSSPQSSPPTPEKTTPAKSTPFFLTARDPNDPVFQNILLTLQAIMKSKPNAPKTFPIIPPRPKTAKPPPPPLPSPKKIQRTKKLNKKLRAINYENGFRQRKQLNLSETKQVLTPSWSAHQLTDENQTDEIEDYDYVHAHFLLEVFEGRIQKTVDPQYKHPAQAYLSAENSDYVFTEEDQKKGEHYEELKIEAKVPSFWPSRPWDENRMSQEMSDQLACRIALLDKPHITASTTVAKGAVKKSKKPKPPASSLASQLLSRMKKSGSILAFPVMKFGTDDEDDMTDLEDI